MGKLIAVCGSPNSGKTTLSLKIAKSIYDNNKGHTVIYVSPDVTVPTLGYVFPNSKDENMYSIGAALDKTDIFEEDIIKQFVTTKTMKDFAILGFKLCENRYSYPDPTEDKICQLFSSLRETADYTVIDCTSDESDLISNIAKRDCDVAVQVYNPDIKSMVFYASCINQFLMIEGKAVKVLNTLDNDLYLPMDEVQKRCGDIPYVIPYSRAIKQQMITGTLIEKVHDAKYLSVIDTIAKAVISDGTDG